MKNSSCPSRLYPYNTVSNYGMWKDHTQDENTELKTHTSFSFWSNWRASNCVPSGADPAILHTQQKENRFRDARRETTYIWFSVVIWLQRRECDKIAKLEVHKEGKTSINICLRWCAERMYKGTYGYPIFIDTTQPISPNQRPLSQKKNTAFKTRTSSLKRIHPILLTDYRNLSTRNRT